MSSRLVSLCLSSSLLSAAALAGCADDPRARFADASLAQLDRTFTSSIGDDLAAAMILGINLAGKSDPAACPAVTTTGVDTTVTGGCTTEHGARFDGAIAIHNVESFPATEPGSVELDLQFTSREGERYAFVGRVDLDAAGVRGDLTLDVGGIQSTSRLDFRCEGGETCTLSPGAEIEISELGTASVEVSSAGASLDGLLEVRGEDVLVLDLEQAHRTPGNCAPYAVGEQRGTVCPIDFFEGFEISERAGGQALAAARPLRWPWSLR